MANKDVPEAAVGSELGADTDGGAGGLLVGGCLATWGPPGPEELTGALTMPLGIGPFKSEDC